MSKEKVILAYSGGLDTTVIIPWLKENFDYEVICVCIDCGQAEELDHLDERAKYCGADKQILLNIRRWNNKIHFEVVDHGAGIKPDELAHIWERYYKSSTNHVRATKGSGLGLSIVSEILTLHKARFGAESKVGKGTTFWFELPLSPDEPSGN